MKEIQQLKLANGDEVFCEVLEWNSDDHEMYAKNVMTLELMYLDEEKFMVFKPYLSYAEQESTIMTFNTKHIMVVNKISELLVGQYFASVRDMHKLYKEREQEFYRRQLQYVSKLADQITNDLSDMSHDSDDNLLANVISFPNKDDIVH